MFIAMATNRIIRVTRKCFKDCGLLDVGRSACGRQLLRALTSVPRGSAHTLPLITALHGAQRRILAPAQESGPEPVGAANTSLSLIVGTRDVWQCSWREDRCAR